MRGSANLNVMLKAARKAGRTLVKDFKEVENLQVSTKGAGDFVSRADIAAEKILKIELMGARPSYGWLAEEGGEEPGKDPTAAGSSTRWTAPRISCTGCRIGRCPSRWNTKGEIVAGVVYDPAKDEAFFAEKGAGAWMNESRLRVSGRHKMSEAIFATGLPYGGRADLPETLQDLARLLPACAGVRRWGAAALDMAYVAAGRYDGFWERRLSPWDLAAGVIIVREAGGLVDPLTKGENIVESGDVICANEPLFDKFVSVIRG